MGILKVSFVHIQPLTFQHQLFLYMKNGFFYKWYIPTKLQAVSLINCYKLLPRSSQSPPGSRWGHRNLLQIKPAQYQRRYHGVVYIM
jgi:hypothetical protein